MYFWPSFVYLWKYRPLIFSHFLLLVFIDSCICSFQIFVQVAKTSLICRVITISLINGLLANAVSLLLRESELLISVWGKNYLYYTSSIILAAAFFSTNMMYEKANNIYSKYSLMLQSITCFPQTFSIQTSVEMEKNLQHYTTPYTVLLELLMTVNWASVCYHWKLTILS